MRWVYTALSIGLLVSGVAIAQKKLPPPSPVIYKSNRLNYTPDSLGNRVPDFSYAGYKGGNETIPYVEAKIMAPLKTKDATNGIQNAINYLSALPVDKNGFRGAIQLQPGTYQLSGRLRIDSSGIILRGAGFGTDGTTLLATGTDRETLITIAGKNNKKVQPAIQIIDAYVPVNAMQFHVATADNIKVGDRVSIRRPSTQKWIDLIGTKTFGGGVSALGWKPGDRDIIWNRKVIAVNSNKITIDAPITTALDTTYGGATISVYEQSGLIENIGIENLSLQSVYDKSNPKDEAHCWFAITMNNMENAWIRQVRFTHFAGSAVALWEDAGKVTVEDCKSLSPISEIGGWRRNTFYTAGTQTLFQRCYAEAGYHDFATGFCAAGPNAFVQCYSKRPYSFSGSIDSWASGVLFDMTYVDGEALRYRNREQDGQGAGWAAANSVFWQCSAAQVDCYQPPGAQNWAFGTWAQFGGNGYWESSNESISPNSLYYAQLEQRLNKKDANRSQLLLNETNATSSPSVAQAAEMIAFAVNPLPTIADWIEAAPKRNPIKASISDIKSLDDILNIATKPAARKPVLQIKNGWLVCDDVVQTTGFRYDSPWWTGGILPTDIPKMKPAITRFVPGRTGTGFTDDLDDLTDTMQQIHSTVFEQNYALWYERRRDDHERIRRASGDVWAPFYELPFARTGKDSAWDGLSKYDLTKYNSWYWNRLNEFANLADRKGLILINKNYFQHNIIEAGAHYVDFPWRPVNNINNTGFPEPVPFAGDKRVFMAEQFYDTTNAIRKKLHKAFIDQNLANFKSNSSVIQEISEEFTGPLHFVQFWLDEIKNWEAKNKTKELISLATTKDVQDAILADAKRAAVVDVIDIRQWYYQFDSTTYEPKGGQNLAPRQHARLLKPKRSSFGQVYRAVSEYRTKFPDKAVLYSGDGYDEFGWAVLMAGGSLPHIPVVENKGFLKAASTMQPVATTDNGRYQLSGKKGLIVYAESGSSIPVDASALSGSLKVHWLNPKTGATLKEETMTGGGKMNMDAPNGGAVVLWIENTL